jgi:excisionase family DNA binding protein
MYTVEEIANKLKVSCSTVYSLVEQGLLRCHRIGVKRGTIRVTEEQLQEFLTTTEVKPTSSAPSELRHIRLPS